jgi:hypothetical protein
MKRALCPLLILAACGNAEEARPRGDKKASERTWFDVEGDLTNVGFDRPISVDVRPANARAGSGEISWRQVSGPPLSDLETSDHGFHLSARTPRLTDLVPLPLPWGILPLSPRTRGDIVLEAEWHHGRGSAVVRKRVEITSAARSRGLPNVPVHQRIYLGGGRWHVTESPPGDAAPVEDESGVSTFVPDREGTWTLADEANRTIRLQAGRYDETPLDCGREGCHRDLANRAQNTAMTWALARRLNAAESKNEISCAVACHATGEPSTRDGGFLDVATEIGSTPAFDHVHDIGDLPRSLRRLGSVGCLACHGPGALPEAGARWSILRADVCAFCHDAPPRYGHVEGWRASMMSHADRDRTARESPRCVGCHTTWGFLERQAGSTATHPRRPPQGIGEVGIACAGCHDVHGSTRDASNASTGGDPALHESLLREIRTPTLLADLGEPLQSSRTCLPCHAPDGTDGLPQASASALLAGRGGVDPRTGVPLKGPTPHLGVPKGCIGCHDSGPVGLTRGANHAFAPNPARCPSCHATDTPTVSSLLAQAADLWRQLVARRIVLHVPTRDEPLPAHATDTLRGDPKSPLSRAAKNLALLLEDRAAAVHNPAYAKLLLDKSREAIERARP